MEANPETPRDKLGKHRLWWYNLDSSSSTGSQVPGPYTRSLNLLFKEQPGIWRQAMVASGCKLKIPSEDDAQWSYFLFLFCRQERTLFQKDTDICHVLLP